MGFLKVEQIVDSRNRLKENLKNGDTFAGLIFLLKNATCYLNERLFITNEGSFQRDLDQSFYLSEPNINYETSKEFGTLLTVKWIESCLDLIGGEKISAIDFGISLYWHNSFDSEESIVDKLKTSLSEHAFDSFFHTEAVGVEFSETIPVSKRILWSALGGVENRYTLKYDGNFIQARASELSRAPFFQTNYASIGSRKVLITPIQVEDLNFLENNAEREISNNSSEASLQKIYFGPPGTGKSHRANELIGSALCTKTQFHPEYSYGDFVGSYRPVVGSHLNDKAKDPQEVEIPLPINYFSFVPGPLMVALVDALKKYLHDKSSPEPHYLLVDEINRGDCSSIFGDIFQLLDRNSEGFSEYGIDPRPEIKIWLDNEFKEIGDWAIKEENKLSLPPNFIILGTMNTSDQNLYPMDTAFKRRWEWESCSVEEEYEILLKKYANNTPVLEFKEKKYEWIKLLRKLNRLITSGQQGMEDKQIGPWFIKPALDDGTICSESFANKLLFYLWCDVFKDELDSESSPFINYHEEQNEINTFGMLQSLFKVKGLEAIFKPEILKDCLVQSSNVGASGEEPKILAESPSIDESEQVAKH